MQPIEWVTDKESPGPYDTRFGMVAGERRFRIDSVLLSVDDRLDKWQAEYLEAGVKSDELSYAGCVDWCWARLVASEPD